ncbi:phosphotransferase family protein [Rhodococcus qingshengii]|uniref:phosphotransferase family protein n=1 Tax=Rhodococcus qingshengii TaxID=334542 RepID=UPI00237CA07D|nr:phosphotransferase family protein [Rhodococcus qingshengii]WCT06044.1 phosphotransferase family protein [Rhodococcus qingshengii]
MSTTTADASTELDLVKLGDHLSLALPDGITGTLSADLIAGGRSNPTYRLTDGEQVWVLRRPPYGHVLPSAHDMRREFTVIDALQGTAVPVPAAIHLCEDESILGASFYLMDMVDGVGVGTVEQARTLDAADRRRLGFELADTLAALHDIDPHSVGLSEFGRPHGYLERQLRRWEQQWQASSLTCRPEADLLLGKLGRALPQRSVHGIVHGDVKLDNVLVSASDRGRIVAVLDWEMATLGDTLADVGVMLSFWDTAGIPHHPITRGLATLEGFPSRTEMLERYALARGIDLPDVDWYIVFADLKIAIIMEGIAARHARGETVGDGFEGVSDMAEPLMQRALDLASRSTVPELRR